jgi:hypothetical protein
MIRCNRERVKNSMECGLVRPNHPQNPWLARLQDCERPSLHDSKRACKSWSFERRCAPKGSKRFEHHSPGMEMFNNRSPNATDFTRNGASRPVRDAEISCRYRTARAVPLQIQPEKWCHCPPAHALAQTTPCCLRHPSLKPPSASTLQFRVFLRLPRPKPRPPKRLR